MFWVNLSSRGFAILVLPRFLIVEFEFQRCPRHNSFASNAVAVRDRSWIAIFVPGFRWCASLGMPQVNCSSRSQNFYQFVTVSPVCYLEPEAFLGEMRAFTFQV